MVDKVELLMLLEEKQRRQYEYRYKYIFGSLYGWQQEFIGATSEYTQCCLIAANRIGKTHLGTYIDSIHALGDYPDEWNGHKFEHPPLIWCLGYSGEKTRDLLQSAIVGKKQGDKFMGGLVPADRIIGHESMAGTTNALRSVFVRHASGGTSTIQFWSYSQGQHALMGDAVDWFHIDEEPRDRTIFPQVLVRTATGDKNKGGRGILTFTPENGRTELVIQFLDSPSQAQFCMQKGWDDAPHLSEKVKAELLASFPVHQREMRTRGVPMLGHGRIYDFSEELVSCEPFDAPDHFYLIDGCDFGYDHPQAQVQLWWDKDMDTFYLAKAWKARNMTPAQAWGATKSWSENVPTAWPQDGLQTEKGSSKQLREYYIEAGFDMLHEHATWPDGGNGVEVGLMELRELMVTGRFKVFSGLRDWFEEFTQYHRDENGKIHKLKEDLLDATRYAYMMRRHAVQKSQIRSNKWSTSINKPMKGIV